MTRTFAEIAHDARRALGDPSLSQNTWLAFGLIEDLALSLATPPSTDQTEKTDQSEELEELRA